MSAYNVQGNLKISPTVLRPSRQMALLFSFPSLMFLLLLSNAVLIHCQICNPIGYLHGIAGKCNHENGTACCQDGTTYPQYRCSPPITDATGARMHINDFAPGGDGGGASECDSQFHSNDEMIVALSTGWFDDGKRCGKYIRINGNGKSVLAKVVDECDSVNGCDSDHDFRPPCDNDIVSVSRAVWDALEIPEAQIGEYSVTWSDAEDEGEMKADGMIIRVSISSS